MIDLSGGQARAHGHSSLAIKGGFSSFFILFLVIFHMIIKESHHHHPVKSLIIRLRPASNTSIGC